ncbi:MAG: hypothetical protein LUH82_01905 [Clostridiales bacterium]|nr:hypothetical protein [Clostridiales bacterium]
MFFKDTITIYRHSTENGADVYERQVLSGFYCYSATTHAISNKGFESVSEFTAISSPGMAQIYGDEWTVRVGDIIIGGEGDNISTLKELSDYHKVYHVALNACGSAVDNIVVKGK